MGKLLEAYGVLVHEIAHCLLGHLGKIVIKKYIKKENAKEEIIDIVIASDRKDIKENLKELEAELTAWIVFFSF